MELSRALRSGENDPVVVIRLRQLKSHVVILVVRILVFQQHPTIQSFDLSPNPFRRGLVLCITRGPMAAFSVPWDSDGIDRTQDQLHRATMNFN